MARLALQPGDRIALAVSGGGDSIALMHLFKDWKAAATTILIVDHGLRAGSAKEAARVRSWAKRAGFAAEVLTWKHSGKQDTAIEERARQARLSLLGTWCRKHRVGKLILAHTRDDQAETFLLRLARGSGVDGLSAMRPASALPLAGFETVTLYRPLLGIARSDLRAFLKRSGIAWLDDPMNEDPRFARVRMRRLLPLLEEAGLSVSRIAEAAGHLARARAALDGATGAFLATHAQIGRQTVLLDRKALIAAPAEIALRVLAALLGRVSGAPYRPRFERLENLFAALGEANFSGRTLAGCRIGPAPKARAQFGPGTLEIRAETARRNSAPGGPVRRAKPANAGLPKKLPQKGRNRVAILNS